MAEVTTIILTGGLGLIPATNDGVAAIIGSGISVAGKFALGDVLGPFYSVKDAENYGITSLYDSTNKVLIWHHINDFYNEAGNGNQLFVQVVANSVTLKDMADKTLQYANKLISATKGLVKLIALSRVPPSNYVPVVTAGIDQDVLDAVINAQALYTAVATTRPVNFIIEGRKYGGTVGSLQNERDADGPNANHVSVSLIQDPDIAALDAQYTHYADVGTLLGRLAAYQVQRNAGRVKAGQLNKTNLALSDGTLISDMSITDLKALNDLNDLGYIVGRTYDGQPGYYFFDDPTCTPIDDDFGYISRCRPFDKAVRLTYQKFTEDLLDDIDIDASTGKIPVEVCKGFQQKAQSLIEDNMINIGTKEISGVKVKVDESQNVLTTNQLKIKLRLIPKGSLKTIEIELGYDNPFVSTGGS